MRNYHLLYDRLCESIRGSAKEADASGIAANLMSFTKQVLASKEMWLMVMAVTIGILVVNFVRTRGVDHSWKIASAAGQQ